MINEIDSAMQVTTFIILAKQIPRSGRIIHLAWTHKDFLDSFRLEKDSYCDHMEKEPCKRRL